MSSDSTASSEHDALEVVQAALRAKGSVNESGDDWTCPAHEDGRASLTVKAGDLPGHVVMACGAGCTVGEVLNALGLTDKDLFEGEPKPKAEKVGKPTHYFFNDEEDQPLYRITRWALSDGGKTFSQAKWDGSRYVRGMDGVRHVLYRLPQLRKAISKGKVIHLTEGEKDADRLNEWFRANDAKAFATCHAGGAGKWSRYEDYTPSLLGAPEIVVWADRDAKGYDCALMRLRSALSAGLVARAVLPVPDFPKADAYDHLSAGHSPHDAKPVDAEELEALAGEAVGDNGEDKVLRDIQALVLASNDDANDHMSDLVDDDGLADIPDPEFIIDNWIPRGVYTVLYGEPGVKKTFAMLGMFKAVRRGTRWQDNSTRKGAVLFYQGEGLAQLKKRAAAWDDRYPLREDQSMSPGSYLERFVDLTKPEGVAAIARTVRKYEAERQTKVELLIIDPLVEFMTGDENGIGMDLATKGLRALAMYLNVGVVVGHHTNASGERARGADFHRMRAGAFIPMEDLGDGQLGLWQRKQKNAEQVAVILEATEHADSLVLEWVDNLPVAAYAMLKESERRQQKERGKTKDGDDKRRRASDMLLDAARKSPGMSQSGLVAACKGRGAGTEYLEETIRQMADPTLGLFRVEEKGQARLHYANDAD